MGEVVKTLAGVMIVVIGCLFGPAVAGAMIGSFSGAVVLAHGFVSGLL